MALATQCPHCYTSFRVANDQLKLYAGMVRCGACKQTFNGIEHLIPPGSTPKQAPEQTQPQLQEESAAERQPEQAQPDPAVISETATDHNDGLDLENNLRALLQEIKVRQLDEEIATNQNAEAAPPSSLESEATPAPDNSAEEALVHLEVIEINEEPHTDHADKGKPNALTASIDFDLDDDHSPIIATREPVKQTLDAEDIEEIRSLEIAIESELDLYDDGESKDEREKEQSIASAINSGTLTNNLRVENLSPEVPTEEEQDPPSQATDSATDPATHTTETEETPDFVRRAQRHQRYGKWTSVALSLGVLVSLIAAIAQSSYFFRNAIAAEYPQAKPHLLKFCQFAKCEIKLPAQRSQLEISGSELQIVTNEPLVNELNFQIQNKGKSAQAWPYLELILKDVRGKTVLQKAIPPSVYLDNKALIATGIPGNSESAHKLNFELAIPKASSYTVELFYP
ncbi:MAG: zinc-ribbon domain-containing protein [Burkholderiales bacterium]|nr:zinc-ribbon domain-containing protein [Burkholderiales bacterium]